MLSASNKIDILIVTLTVAIKTRIKREISLGTTLIEQ